MTGVLLLQSSPPKLEYIQKKIFSKGALDFVANLHREFDLQIEQLFRDRIQRALDLKTNPTLNFKSSKEREDKTWAIAPLPPKLQNRRLDLGDVSPTNAAHLAAALSADVQGVQVDFDDGHCPTWRNQLLAHHHVRLAVRGRLPGAPAALGACPALLLRPRAWSMTDHDVAIDGKEAIGALVDFGLLMFHNARELVEANAGPYFYLSKVEGAREARLWDDIFGWAQAQLGLPRGTVRACVLVENVVSAFEMDEILFALRDHCIGLNCGVWDYCASIVAKFGDRREFLLPDRNKYVSMERRFLDSYLRLAVRTCRARGALATGGMAAAVLPPGAGAADRASEAAVAAVLEAKRREIEAGVHGFLVYDLRLVPHLNELWSRCGGPAERAPDAGPIAARDLLAVPGGGATAAGLRRNAAVAVLFVYHRLAGAGHFFYGGGVEDSATAEISRAQLWQWARLRPALEGGEGGDGGEGGRADLRAVRRAVQQFAARARRRLCRSRAERKRLSAAAHMCLELVAARDPPEFFAAYLNDSHKFRTLHNKALLSHL